MCDPYRSARVAEKCQSSAEKKLSDLIQRETGINIDPHVLRLFVKLHWARVSTLAHQIHDGEDAVR